MTDQTHFPVIENVCIAVTYVDVIKSVLFRMFLVCSFLLLISSYFLLRFKTERSWLVKLHNFQKNSENISLAIIKMIILKIWKVFFFILIIISICLCTSLPSYSSFR